MKINKKRAKKKRRREELQKGLINIFNNPNGLACGKNFDQQIPQLRKIFLYKRFRRAMKNLWLRITLRRGINIYEDLGRLTTNPEE